MTINATDTTGASGTSDITVDVKLTGGKGFWRTNLTASGKSIMVADGPHGLRVQPEYGDHLGGGGSLPATCFPPAVGLASTWNPDLLKRVGVAIASEARAQGVGVVLGPGINIKRDPRCGRNFEYFSEDPFLTGSLAGAFVTGVQSLGVGTSLKHFAANNQETDRMRRDSQVDERTLREIYLRAFERVVKTARPWTVMCAYNSLNGALVSENRWLLTEVLREEWGFEGVVVSDWGAVRDRRRSLPAGLDLEMPVNALHEAQVLEAVQDGELDRQYVTRAARRVEKLIERANQASRDNRAGQTSSDSLSSQASLSGSTNPGACFDVEAHHDLARLVAEQAIVLLKNDGLLPLRPEASVAVVGEFAVRPRYQGAGSSRVNPTRLDNALDSIKEIAKQVEYATDPQEALAAAGRAEVVVFFAGLDASHESEGFDRRSIDLPAEQLQLLDDLLAVNPKVVVVLSNGAVVSIPFADKAPAIMEGWLLGQAGGSALANVLFGKANPCGKLAETIPLRLQDCPSYPHFPGDKSGVRYGEGLFVGYRGFDARELPVGFPFGHGLSYTTFAYGSPRVRVHESQVGVELPVTNTGAVAGREVVQVYVGVEDSKVVRAPRELKGFTGVYLEPGETKTVSIDIDVEDLGYWSVREGRFAIEAGKYRVFVGASSRDIRHEVTITLPGDETPQPLTLLSTVAEVMAYPGAAEQFADLIRDSFGGGDMGVDTLDLMRDAPMSAIAGFTNTDPALIESKLHALTGSSPQAPAK